MGETASTVPAVDAIRPEGLETDKPLHPAAAAGVSAGLGLAGAMAGAGLGFVAAWLLLLMGHDFVSLPSVITRAVFALAILAAGVVLGARDRLPLPAGAGLVVGGMVGVVFGSVAWSGLAWAAALGVGSALLGMGLSLTQIPPLVRRELNAYFLSPIVYVVATVFLLFFGLILYLNLVMTTDPIASLAGPIGFVTVFLLPVIAPILTMRLLAEEMRSGTMEVLMTSPVRDWEVVVAKFVSALAALGVILLPTSIHVLSLYLVSEQGPAAGPLIGGYIGVALTGALFLSLGLLASALSRDQIVAAIIGFAFSLGVFLLGIVGDFDLRNDWFGMDSFARAFFQFISYSRHLFLLSSGRIETRSVIFLVSLIVFALFLTVRVVESRKWR